MMLLIGPCRPDKIELEKGLGRWARSSYWLDDTNMPEKDGQFLECPRCQRIMCDHTPAQRGDGVCPDGHPQEDA